MSLPTYFNSPNAIILRAMQDSGKIQRGDDPNSDQLADYFNRLNEMVLFAQTRGIKLWLQLLQAIQLVAGQATYMLSPTGGLPILPKPTRVLSGYFLDPTGNQRPLETMSWDTWNKLSNKNQAGQINSYFSDKQAFVINLSFWLTPDAIAALGTAQMLIQQQQPTATQLTDTMQLPQEWSTWLHWGLADQICTGQPQAIMDRCKERAEFYFNILSDWDVEDAPVTFQPDVRGGRFGSRR